MAGKNGAKNEGFPLLLDSCRAAILSCRKMTQACGTCTDACNASAASCSHLVACTAAARETAEPLGRVIQEVRSVLQTGQYAPDTDQYKALENARSRAEELMRRAEVAEHAPEGEEGKTLCSVLYTLATEAISALDVCIEQFSPPQESLAEQYQKSQKARARRDEQRAEKITDQKAKLTHERKSFINSYLPLLTVFGAGLLFAAFMCWYRCASWCNMRSFMHDAMGFMLTVLGILKLVNLREFARVFSRYDLIASALPAYGYMYPLIEIGLGLSFLKRLWPEITYGLTAGIMLIGALGIGNALFSKSREADKSSESCGCLGMVFDLPLSHLSLLENIVMAIGSLSMYFM